MSTVQFREKYGTVTRLVTFGNPRNLHRCAAFLIASRQQLEYYNLQSQ